LQYEQKFVDREEFMDLHVRRDQHHWAWDRNLPPVLTVASGATMALEVSDASGGQLLASSTARDVLRLDLSRVNPVTGPIYVEGAEPGDVVRVTILDVKVGPWGWTACIPGFGLLADQFPDPHLLISQMVGSYVVLPIGVQVPLTPFVGTIGLAPAEPGPHSLIPPRRVGGNMDMRHLTPGARVFLPVEVPGGLLSVGDCHAAQGDGEVCGTAVEVSATVVLRVDVLKHLSLRYPMVETHPVANRHGSALVTTGIGPDLLEAARQAVRGMVDEMARRAGLDPADAYCLASVAGDLKIAEVVDAPHWVVAFHLERSLLNI